MANVRNIGVLAGGWLLTWAAITLVIILTGGLVGAVLGLVSYPIFELAGKDYAPQWLVARGWGLGWRYAGVWAMGVSIVICFILGHRRRQRSGDSSILPSA
ncbi:MAG: hypothetical protein ACFBZ8_11770 [Opitutales bacterium]